MCVYQYMCVNMHVYVFCDSVQISVYISEYFCVFMYVRLCTVTVYVHINFRAVSIKCHFTGTEYLTLQLPVQEFSVRGPQFC